MRYDIYVHGYSRIYMDDRFMLEISDPWTDCRNMTIMLSSTGEACWCRFCSSVKAVRSIKYLLSVSV